MILFETTSEKPSIRRAIGPAAALAAVAVAAVAWFAWHEWSGSQASSGRDEGTAAGSGSPVTVVISGDTAGWIVPCGCTSNQSGGLPRRGTLVAEHRSHEPVVVADAGGAPGGTSPYQRARFEAILDGELAMGMAAHNLGDPEIALGIDYLKKLVGEKHAPFISASLRDAENRPVFEPFRVVEAGGTRVALIGVVAARSGLHSGNLRITEPREAVLEALAALRGKFDWSIVLAYLPERGLRELAESLPEVDAVIGGPTGQSLAPERIGPTLLASATNKGKFVARILLSAKRDAGPPSAEVVELSKNFADDPAQSENVRTFRRELARRDFEAAESGFAPPLVQSAPADYRMAGTAACLACHGEEHETWSSSNHSQAWATLAPEGAQADPFCQQCHTTGYGVAGGFQSLAKSTERVSVGCESCHGPSAAHVKKPQRHTPLAAKEQCTKCHDHENSPGFEFASYWAQVEHGPAR